jgi:hypothetical protein
MENPNDQPLKVLKDQLTEYIELKSEQARLGLIENSAKIVASFSSAIIIIALVMFCMLSILVACSLFLGQYLHSYGLGFLISAGVYLLLLVLYLIVWRKRSETSIINKIIRLTNDNGNN